MFSYKSCWKLLLKLQERSKMQWNSPGQVWVSLPSCRNLVPLALSWGAKDIGMHLTCTPCSLQKSWAILERHLKAQRETRGYLQGVNNLHSLNWTQSQMPLFFLTLVLPIWPTLSTLVWRFHWENSLGLWKVCLCGAKQHCEEITGTAQEQRHVTSWRMELPLSSGFGCK